ncbi:beclin-1-like protein [Onthophagus taurus]|uniref:beclin-1-like protein n=1 Tax=Onthophagus taurus TaxID=166361 RepID=UPI000C20C7F5|nr:beclin-1-like protein [Onthophagus taurus]
MADDKILVYFKCQHCLQPLRLDESLDSFSEHIFAELTLPISSVPDVDLESQATSFDHYVHPCRLSDSGNGATGFMLISDGREVEMETLSHKMRVRAVLFDLVSDNSFIDHPLCDECTDSVLQLLEQQIQLVQTDCEDFTKYYNKLEKDTKEPSLSELQKELEDVTSEEKRLMEELDALEQEEKLTLEAIKEEELKAKELAKEENNYWEEYITHREDYDDTDDEYKSLERQLQYTQTQLEKLTNTNVFNATFHIWHSGHFGTINNFRLGRLPSVPVEWSEINAAWGQIALLLTALTRKINLNFEKYKLVPYGNHSYIEVLADQKELPLYGSGGFRFLWDTKFDAGMTAFLDCLQQFKEKVEQLDTEFIIPYRMSKGKIEDANASYSIKIQFNSEEQWTKALKFMLTNLKWTLAWVSLQFKDQEDVTL